MPQEGGRRIRDSWAAWHNAVDVIFLQRENNFAFWRVFCLIKSRIIEVSADPLLHNDILICDVIL
jgi:hypothetical protein